MAAEICSYVTPYRLYRYRSLKNFDREMDALKKGYVYCSSYVDLNDPMEGVYTPSRLLRKSDDAEAVTREVFDQKSSIRICSFSEVYGHELMWAHYADQFGGICIAYNFSDLREKLPDGTEFTRMYYNEEIPTVGKTKKPAVEIAKRVLSYKNHRWLYEREWRMFAPRPRVDYRDPACVYRVYLGNRILPENRQKLTQITDQLGIEHRMMNIDGYELSFPSGAPRKRKRRASTRSS